MGYMCHHAIIVSSYDHDKLLAKAHEVAVGIFPHVSNIVPHIKNGGGSFFVPPDGSKEGWPDSDEGDKRRAQFVKWLQEQCYDDFSTSLPWIEVQYADDEKETFVVSNSDTFFNDNYQREENEDMKLSKFDDVVFWKQQREKLIHDLGLLRLSPNKLVVEIAGSVVPVTQPIRDAVTASLESGIAEANEKLRSFGVELD